MPGPVWHNCLMMAVLRTTQRVGPRQYVSGDGQQTAASMQRAAPCHGAIGPIGAPWGKWHTHSSVTADNEYGGKQTARLLDGDGLQKKRQHPLSASACSSVARLSRCTAFFGTRGCASPDYSGFALVGSMYGLANTANSSVRYSF